MEEYAKQQSIAFANWLRENTFTSGDKYYSYNKEDVQFETMSIEAVF
jgi:hypothetical protein